MRNGGQQVPFWAKEFFLGVSKPSLPAYAGALAIAFLLTCLHTWWITPGLLATDSIRYFYSEPYDPLARVSGELWRVKTAPEKGPHIFFTGTSTVEHSVLSGHLQSLLRERTGTAARVHLLTLPGVTPWEQAAMAEFLRERKGSVWILGITPRMLCSGLNELASLAGSPRIPIYSTAFDEEVRHYGLTLPGRTGYFYFDFFPSFFAPRSRLYLNLATSPIANPDLTPSPPRSTEADWAAIAQHDPRIGVQRLWIERYADNHGLVFAVYARTIERIRAAGSTPVLLEGVQHPRVDAITSAIPVLKQRYEQYARDMAGFVGEHNVTYWNLRDPALLQPEDFDDYLHVGSNAGRRRYTEELASRVFGILHKGGTETAKK